MNACRIVNCAFRLVLIAVFLPPVVHGQQCSNTVLLSEGFESGGFSPGWSVVGNWFLLPAGVNCSAPCELGTVAFAGYLPTGGCDCRVSISQGNCCQLKTLQAPPVALPSVGPSDFISLAFCAAKKDDLLFCGGKPNGVEIFHDGGSSFHTLAVKPDGQYKFDLTPYAGQVVTIRWHAQATDSEGHVFFRVDNIAVTLHSGAGGDCNGNLVPDNCDLSDGTSEDCDSNSKPDECDILSGQASDCNTNGIPDSCDVGTGASSDCDNNGVPDSCDLSSGVVPDCNGNAVPDSCDIADGSSNDFDGDGTPDECQCSHQTYCETSPNSVGLGALISISGSTSKTLNDTMLLVNDVPPGEIGIFFYGANQVQIPFGDGWRCVATMVERLLPSVPIDVAGHGAYLLDLQGPPPAGTITPGSTWNFQFWYRDPIPVGVGYNLSDAVEITFCP